MIFVSLCLSPATFCPPHLGLNACILCWQCVVVPHAVVHIEGEQVTEYFDDLVKVEGAHTHARARTHLLAVHTCSYILLPSWGSKL